MYVPVNRQTSSDSNDRKQITLKYQLTARDKDYNDPAPVWKLKITQLECQVTATNLWKIKDVARQIFKDKAEEDNTNSKYSLGKTMILV